MRPQKPREGVKGVSGEKKGKLLRSWRGGDSACYDRHDAARASRNVASTPRAPIVSFATQDEECPSCAVFW